MKEKKLYSFVRDYKQVKVYDEKKFLLGEISGLLFNIDFERIIGCIYKKSFLQYRYFLFKDIIKNKKNGFFISEKKAKSIFYEIIGKPVKNEENLHVGIIEDIEFDITQKLKYIIIDCGYNLKLDKKNILQKNFIKVSKKYILEYKKDYIVIEDREKIKENKKILEKIPKIFINIKNPSYNINRKKYD